MHLVLVILTVLTGLSTGRPQNDEDNEAVHFKGFVKDVDGNYRFGYENEDGSSRQEKGTILNAGTDNETIVVHGYYSYKSKDEQDNDILYKIFYVADDQGFRPEEHRISKTITEKPSGQTVPVIGTRIGSAVLASLVGGGIG